MPSLSGRIGGEGDGALRAHRQARVGANAGLARLDRLGPGRAVVAELLALDLARPAEEDVVLEDLDPRGILEDDLALGDQDVLLEPVLGGARERHGGVGIGDEDVVADRVPFRHVVVGGAGDAESEVAFDDAALGLLVEVVGRGAIAAGIRDVADEVAAERDALAEGDVDAGAVVHSFIASWMRLASMRWSSPPAAIAV